MRLLWISILIPISYVSFYLFLVRHDPALTDSSESGPNYVLCIASYSVHPQVDNWLRCIFEPIHFLDRRVRPGSWFYEK